MALLNFPPSPLNNQLYPTNPLPGQSQYRYDSTTQTWVLEGAATAVAPGCYGDAYNVPTFCVDAQGRLTFAQNVAIGVTGGTVTSITAGFGLLGGTITTSGTIDLDTSFTDSLYLQLAGGTMAGDITFSGTQSFPGVLPLAGGTMTGDITFSGTQTFPFQTLDDVTTAGNTTTNSIDVGGLTAAGLVYPSVDGAAGDYLSTDGGGNLGWVTPPTETLQSVTDNGATTTNSIDVAGLTASGLIYPASDGVAKEVITTDGAGNLGWAPGLPDYSLAAPPQILGLDSGTGDPAWTSTLPFVAPPNLSSDPGTVGECAFDNVYFYMHDGIQWNRVAWDTTPW